MPFVVFNRQQATLEEYVTYWSRIYHYRNENLYSNNIGKPLTRTAILELFAWKNGTKLSGRKRYSVVRNFVEGSRTMPIKEDRKSHLAFIARPGGAIWRIFWLHCNQPSEYPIFDQHVYRAMTFLKTGVPRCISSKDNRKAELYWDEYLPFHRSLQYALPKKLDEALWAHGKFLSRYLL